MPEARVDPLSGLRTMVASERAGRPHAWPPLGPPQPLGDDDPFAEGNEAMTPPEVWADRPHGSQPDTPGWRVRAVPNKYPALDQGYADEMPASGLKDPLGATRGMPQLLVSAPANGVHEVIVNSPRAVRSLAELSLEELDIASSGWADRIAANTEDPGAQYVHVCVNERVEAGATLPHTHAQLFALPFVPPAIARERERMRAYYEHTQGRNLIEDLLVEEVRGGERLVAIDDSAALVTPFASATPYRLAVIPRRPESHYEQSASRGVTMLHAALAALAGALGDADGTPPPLNIWIRTAPRGAEGYSWRIEIAPRIGQPAGFELGTGVGINAVAPEDAAHELRGALA
jgi:UDPglucose--hexose-1-phosphate uridylyltransferase